VKPIDATINHVALAVPRISEFLERFDVLFGGLRRSEVVSNPRQRVNELFVTDGKTVLEILEPADERSPLDGFLKRNASGGLVHVALDVDDVDEAAKVVVAAGGVLIGPPTPDVAFDERRILFVQLHGHVVELIERRLAGERGGCE
jgi:methylmalonyl-CoA/ethylmalonyl-CoA epimerase